MNDKLDVSMSILCCSVQTELIRHRYLFQLKQQQQLEMFIKYHPKQVRNKKIYSKKKKLFFYIYNLDWCVQRVEKASVVWLLVWLFFNEVRWEKKQVFLFFFFYCCQGTWLLLSINLVQSSAIFSVFFFTFTINTFFFLLSAISDQHQH